MYMKKRELEKQLKVLANRRRLAIIQYLKIHHEAPVTEIAGAIHLSFKSTSKHLIILSAASIVEKEQQHLQVFYRLSGVYSVATKSIIKLL